MATHITVPWLLIGDFNLTRVPSDNNNLSFNSQLASRFNRVIDALQLYELPLRDRLYTWSNKRAMSTMAKLDRAFICTGFGNAFLATFLTSAPRPTSDHTPIITTIQSNIPKSKVFRFEQAWLLAPSYLPRPPSPRQVLPLPITPLPLWLHRSRRQGRLRRFGHVSNDLHLIFTTTVISSLDYLTTSKSLDLCL